MENKIENNIIKLIPELLKIDADSSNCADFFEKIKNLVEFDNYYVFLLNSEDVKLVSTSNRDYEIDTNYDLKISQTTKEKLFLPKTQDQNDVKDFIKILGLNTKFQILPKLSIKNCVYGIVLFENNKEYSFEQISTAEAICAILSYKIKDSELSNVFKIQTKALKNAIEETHEANQIIIKQNKKILAADKVKNEFLASVSHELRTPLNAIIGFSDILSTQVYGKLNEKQLEYISDIQVSGLQLLGMVNEILDISKIEANAIKLVKRYFEVSRPIIETCNLVLPLIKNKNITIKHTIQKDIDIFADYQKVQQILYNLISNAIKYTPEDGNIDITVTNTKKNVQISVKDSGQGIEKKYHKKIFQKFFQLENAFYKKETSTGLGLAITLELVKLHKGNIKVKSELGKGAEFIVTLPIELTSEPLV